MTRNTAHTPGPWFVVGREIHDRITEFDESGARIGSTPNSIAEIHVMPFGNQEANARLIAAAPEMADALRSAGKMLQFAANATEDEDYADAASDIEKLLERLEPKA